MRVPITAEQRLLSILRYLISGDSFEELKFQTAIVAQTLGKIIVETCEAFIYVLKGCIKVSVYLYCFNCYEIITYIVLLYYYLLI